MAPIGIETLLSLPPIESLGPRLGGMGLDGAIPFISSGGARVMAEAILYRVFKAVARIIDPTSFVAATRLADYLLGTFLEQGEPTGVLQHIYSVNVSRRRKILLKAYYERRDRGQNHPKIADITPFSKKELLAWFKPTDDGPVNGTEYVPRLIQAPHDETHLIAGRYLKPLLSRLKQVWNKSNWIFYGSVDPDTLNDWLQEIVGFVSYYESDYSAFDCTYSMEAWRLLESFYRRIYPDAEQEFWDVLDIWRAPFGVYRSRKEDIRIEYQAEVCNASGRDDTALANALLNGIVMSLSISAAVCGKTLNTLTPVDLAMAQDLVRISVVGDDSLVAARIDLAPFKDQIDQNIRSFGLSVKSAVHHDLDHVTFLGMMPYRNERGYTWGPTIGRRLYKAFWQADPKGNLPAWTHGVAKQLSLYRNVPILYEMAERIKVLLSKHKVTMVAHDADRPWTSITSPMPQWDYQTLLSLSNRYPGLTPNMIRRDIRTIESVERLPAIVHLESLDLILCHDDL